MYPAPLTSQQLLRASQQLLAMFAMIGATLLLLIGFRAFGQTVDVAPVVVDQPRTILGYVFIGILSLVVLGVGWLVLRVTKFIDAKTKQTNISAAETFGWGVVNKAWLKATNIGAKLYAKEKNLIEKILSDGVVTPAEFKTFRDAIAVDLRLELQNEIPVLANILGGSTGLGSMIEGFATKVANGLLAKAQATPVAAPLPVVIPSPVDLIPPAIPPVAPVPS